MASRTLIPMRFGRVMATRVGRHTWVKTNGHFIALDGGVPVPIALTDENGIVFTDENGVVLTHGTRDPY